VRPLTHPLPTVVPMARARVRYACMECGGVAPKWAGRCPSCGAWNTLVEEHPEDEATETAVALPASAGPATSIVDVAADGADRRAVGIDEVDRVLGGGLVPGSVTLVGGEPGVGKSTLLLQVLVELAWKGERVLYVSAEESAAQVRARAERLGALSPDLWLLAEPSLDHILTAVEDVGPAFVVVDSIQTVASAALRSAPGSVAQVRDCAHRLVEVAKRTGAAVLLIGHVTKDGSLAGPRVLEHLVDTVLEFSGDRRTALRVLRASKHRFGATSEVGLFEMRDSGLRGVPDPSELFLSDRARDVAGSIVVPALDGRRPFLVEVQALVAPGVPGAMRRNAEGLDRGRLDLLIAVLAQRLGLPILDQDVYALVVGGARIDDPGADLGTVMAVTSARWSCPLPSDLVAVGEVGLGGEIRQVAQLEARLAEAARLGFAQAVVPPGAPDPPVGMRVHRAADLFEAFAAVDLHHRPPPPTPRRR
jgi:DNA repair protein RadA/Sms